MDHERKARGKHRMGFNCSTSVFKAFKDVDKSGNKAPAPRSIAGKCGALLAAQQVLRDLGIPREDELEQAFKDQMGYITCVELKQHRCNCNDCVGTAARMVDFYLAEQAAG
ncbi:MAG: hypothetical protein Q4B54_04935 [Coriobacteriales bacterium]|nr:hypothetical protein [Coriobacteriales bacterium]